jgi:acyl-CoA dehydrogenase
MVSILGRKEDGQASSRSRRATPILFVLRPGQSKGLVNVRKIKTLGVRSAFVGEFEVKDHEVSEGDVIATDREAWEAVLGTVALGKFFLGFGSIGICERAFGEAIAHLSERILFGKPVIEMPHIGSATAQAFARLTAMKMYAYRALDYVQAATAEDRRYLLYSAVQKARVSTEGVKVMSLLLECVGAKGFESDTYFEMALRDAQLIPGLEGSTHINLGLATEFIPAYFDEPNRKLTGPKSLIMGECERGENPYLMRANGGQIGTIAFPPFRRAYRALWDVPNVRIFVRQAKAFRRFARGRSSSGRTADLQVALAMGQCIATIAYGQLIAESAARLDLPKQIVSVIFHLLIGDLSQMGMTMASFSQLQNEGRVLIKKLIAIPKTAEADWGFVLNQARSGAR